MTLSPMVAPLTGLVLIIIILWDAFETIMVPRRIGRRIRLTRYFYVITWRLWRFVALRVKKPSRRASLLGFYGPLSLIVLLFCWAAGLVFAFALLSMAPNNAAGSMQGGFGTHLYMSGETFFTLGFGDFTPTNTFGRILAVLEAGLGFGFLGTVVGYLPTMYTAFAQREVEISLLDARAGSPPNALELVRRISPSGEGPMCDAMLSAWERWAAQLLETHISYPQLAYYRSQHSNQSWLATLITILDSTSLILARSGAASAPQAKLTFAMARHALVDITQLFLRRYRAGGGERLSPDDQRAIRNQFVEMGMKPSEMDDFERRLTELRTLYEPYAQALGSFLLFDLPPWVLPGPRHNNWQGGPWDKLIHSRQGSAHRGEDHF